VLGTGAVQAEGEAKFQRPLARLPTLPDQPRAPIADTFSRKGRCAPKAPPRGFAPALNCRSSSESAS